MTRPLEPATHAGQGWVESRSEHVTVNRYIGVSRWQKRKTRKGESQMTTETNSCLALLNQTKNPPVVFAYREARLPAPLYSHQTNLQTPPRATPPVRPSVRRTAATEPAYHQWPKKRDAGARGAPAVRSVGRRGAVSARRPGPPLRAAPLRRLRGERVPRPGPRLLRRVALLFPPLGLRRGGPRHVRRASSLLLPAPTRPPARLGLRLALPPAASRRRPRLPLWGGCRNFQFLMMNLSFAALDLIFLLGPFLIYYSVRLRPESSNLVSMPFLMPHYLNPLLQNSV